MELVVQANQKYLDKYKNASAFLFGLKNYSYTTSFVVTIDEIKSIKKNYNKKLFLKIDKNIFNSDLENLEKLLISIDEIGIDGILFYDLSVLNLVHKLNLKTALVWSQDFLVTNYETCNYYYDDGVEMGVVSSVLTTNEIVNLAKNTNMKLFVNIFGYQLMAFSKRKLISNYFNYINEKDTDNYHYMIEKDEKYCICEEKEGTRFLSNKVLNGILDLEALKNSDISYLILNSENVEHDKFLKVLNIYYEALIKNNLEECNNKISEIIPDASKIFFDKKTVYKVKKS